MSSTPTQQFGALNGVKVLDLSALGPGPYASRFLADHGAEVHSIEAPISSPVDIERMYGRGKQSIGIDVKKPGAVDLIRDMLAHYDVLIESMRPGKIEALGLDPEELLKLNPGLIILRLTCFGQYGEHSGHAGHDINAIAVGGALALCGRDRPEPPPTILGDFAAGAFPAVMGVLLALFEREKSGKGQIIDAAMSDGASLLAGAITPLFSNGVWGARGENFFDGGYPFYTTYKCADEKWIAVGSYEPKFYRGLVEALGLIDEVPLEDQLNRARAPEREKLFAQAFSEKSRADWMAIFDEADVCVSPVLELNELADYPHNQSRGAMFTSPEGELHSGVTPRLSRSMKPLETKAPKKGENSAEILKAAGLDQGRIDRLMESGAVF